MRAYWQSDLIVEDVDDLVDVLMVQPVHVAVLHEALAGVDHKDARAGERRFSLSSTMMQAGMPVP